MALLRLILPLLVLAVGFSGAGRMPAQEPPATLDIAEFPGPLRDAMMSGDFAKGLALLEKLEQEAPEQRSTWLYGRAVAQQQMGAFEDALATLEELESSDPDGRWRWKTRFRRAEIWHRMGRYAEAASLLEEETRRIRSAERQTELAEIYLRFGDELSIAKETSRPDGDGLDYPRARALYERVLELEAPVALKERARFRMGECSRLAEHWTQARADYEEYIRAFDPKPETGTGSIQPSDWHTFHWFQARRYFGVVQLSLNQQLGARQSLENVLQDLNEFLGGATKWKQWNQGLDAEARQALVDLQGQIAYTLGYAYPQNGEDALLAIAAWERFLAAHPGHPWAWKARIRIAETYLNNGRQEQAIEACDAYLQAQPPAGMKLEDVKKEAGLRAWALFQKGKLLADQKRFAQATEVFQDYVRRHPNGADWAAAQQNMVDVEYRAAMHHLEELRWPEGREALRQFLETHPLDGRNPSILVALAHSYRSQVDTMVLDAKRQDAEVDPTQTAPLFRAAVAQWRKVISKYPGSNEASQGLFEIGRIQERELGDLQAAIESYAKCNFGSYAGHARQILARMTETSLAIVTPRTWRNHEEAQVEVFVRNLEELQVQVYQLDLEAYFRKHLRHSGIENLDLDLIAPNRSFSVAVEDYEAYKPIRQQLSLPVVGPGVWAVAVTSGELRATTLVLRSDLDLILKSSPREAFLFVQDRVKQEPAKGVRLLCAIPGSRGQGPRMEELETGDDGVARLTLTKEWQASSLEVLAMREGNSASVGFDFGGLQLAQGLQPRGLIYSDRSAYQPGQTVHWRAILRTVKDGAYFIDDSDTYRVSLTDAQGRMLKRWNLPISEFGTLNGSFTLDPAAPNGTYWVLCRTPDGKEYNGQFQVDRYQLQPIALSLEPERQVYYRGEPVQYVARAAYYYGEPLAASPLQIRLPDQRVLDLRTDHKGEAKFSFETRDFRQEGPISLSASLLEEGVHAVSAVYLAVRGYQARLELSRPRYLVDDPFQVRLHVQTPDGKPAARSMQLQVLRQERNRKNQWTEVSVETHLLSSDEEGFAEQSLVLSEGGNYVLRVEGKDRFENPITAEASVTILGEKNAERLFFLAEKSRLKVGETGETMLHNQGEAGLALLTFEGDEVLQYRILKLEEGSNRVQFPVEHLHYPNFNLSISRMAKQRLDLASIEFEVERELSVKLKPSKLSYRPGEEAVVTLEVRDQLNRPVQAELSLAVVDVSLFEMFGDTTPRLKAFFQEGTRRLGSFRTRSSCTFSYRGQTRRIAQELLDEATRRDLSMQMEEKNKEMMANLESLGYIAVDEFASDSRNQEGVFLARRGRSLMTPQSPAAAQSGVALQQATQALEFDAGVNFRGVQAKGGFAGGRRSSYYKYSADKLGTNFALAGMDSLDEEQEAVSTGSRSESAFWSPSVVTDQEGRAQLKFQMPEKSTRWRMISLAVGPQTLVGQSDAEVVTKADFFVELRLPAQAVEGDQPRAMARVHNLTALKGKGELTLTVTQGGQSSHYPVKIELGDSPLVEYLFPALPEISANGDLQLALGCRAELEGQLRQATDSRKLAVQPWGMEQRVGRSGELTDSTVFWLELPKGQSYRHGRLDLRLGPGISRLLVDEALGGPVLPAMRSCLPPNTQADAAGELLGALAVLSNLSGSPSAASDYRRIRDRCLALVSRLVNRQNDKGGWAWGGGAGKSHPESTALALVALTEAKSFGMTIAEQTLEKGLRYLQQAFRQSSSQDSERRCLLIFALARLGEDDFSAANRLHRTRSDLSPAALAWLSLAWMEMDRKPMAQEAARLLETETAPEAQPWQASANQAWYRDPLVMSALGLWALQSCLPNSSKIEPGIRYLMSRHPWPQGRGRGMALKALALHEGRAQLQQQQYRVQVQINGQDPWVAELKDGEPGRSWNFPIADTSGRTKISLRMQGRGRPHFTAVLSAFSRNMDRKDRQFQVTRQIYRAAQPRYRGKEIPVGFSVFRHREKVWENTVENLPLGGLTRARLEFYRNPDRRVEDRDLDYLVLEIPLPSGTRILDGSVRGRFESHRLERGRLILYVGPHRGSGWVEYQLVGALPGEYRVPPPLLTSAYDPSRMAFGKAGNMQVLAKGEASSDEYRQTPDELFHLGKAMFEAGDRKGAYPLLASLYQQFEQRLRDEFLAQAAGMLFFMSLDRDEDRNIVRFFEVLKEKNPELTVPFEEVLRVGDAYQALKEYERAWLIYRATLEESFGKDLKVAGALREQKETHGASEILLRLWWEYPDFPAVVETWLALSETLLQQAPEAHRDPSLRRVGRGRAELTADGIRLLHAFLTLYPKHPLAPEAGLNLVSAYLDFEDYKTTASLAGRFADLFTEPRFADAFLYSRAFAEWYLGAEGKALALLRGIAEAEYQDEDGVRRPSENRDLALYILGQIHHARREVDKASEYYERVAELFSDAREVLAGFREKHIFMEEVTTMRPGRPAPFKIEYRNVQKAEILVYPVDLMTLYLREKNLSNIQGVNLAGISPTLRLQVPLGGGQDLQLQEKMLDLNLPDPGAYLVICRGDELHTSGLVLVTDLELQVKEDPVSGRVRVEVFEAASGRYLRDVDVRVVGSHSQDFVSGHTDPRGLFVADALMGTSTVIARQGEKHYAFFRGEEVLGEVAQQQDRRRIQRSEEPRAGGGGGNMGKEAYIKNIRMFNDDNRAQRQKWLQEEIDRKRDGVQVKQVK